MNPSPDRFDRDTAVTRSGNGRFEARIDRGWWVMDGPNGGYIAAIVLRAITLAVGDPERSPRSLTLHYVARPREGQATIETQIERSGRSLTTVTARLRQGDRLCALALAALSTPRPGHEHFEVAMPDVPPPESLERHVPMLQIHERYEVRFVPEASPGTGSERAMTAAWIRPAEPHALDEPLLAAYADALPPAMFARATAVGEIGPLPTVDLTVHFRREPALTPVAPDEFCLAVFRSRLAHRGYVEEDGEIWTRDGALLVQSRQLAVFL